MSLKEPTKEIFDRYGLSEEDFKAYIVYLAFPQSTVSEVAGMMDKETAALQPITKKLEEKGFIRKIEGIVDRYIPLEPYLELFNEQSAEFREDIDKIKDAVLGDQSNRFENLEEIQENALGEIDTAKTTQVEDFQRESDSHDVDKKGTIDNARDRFTETSKALEDKIQDTTFSARDRFTETSEGVKEHIESSEKQLESDIHTNIDARYQDFENEVNQKDEAVKNLWDKHASKFTEDNNNLNSELDGITGDHKETTNQFEQNIHSMIDVLRNNLNEISEGFKSKYDGNIQSQKDTFNNIIDDLLKDFGSRVEKLEVELKKDLDNHQQYERETADQLKPNLDEILEKYMIRMKKVLDDLKDDFSQLLEDQTTDLTDTNNNMEQQINGKVDARQDQLVEQINSFEAKTTQLISNLIDISTKLSNLGEILASRGSAFKALVLGRHKEWVAVNDEIQSRIGEIGEEIKADFTDSTAGYLEGTQQTRAQLKSEIGEITQSKNEEIKTTNQNMDTKQKEKINAELDTLATDLSQECHDNVDASVKNGKEVIIKLKDSLENSLLTHRENYEIAINKHRNSCLEQKDSSNQEVKENVDDWHGRMEKDHENAKKDVSMEVKNQIREIDAYLNKSKSQHEDHTREFQRDVDSQKTEQRRLYDEMLRTVRDNFDNLKIKTSELIDGEISNAHQKLDEQINLFKDEVAQLDKKQHTDIDEQIDLFTNETKQMEDKLHSMLESHKAAYKENATNLQQRLNKTIQDNIQNVKDAIADFTLNFMNSIDECYELAEENESKLGDINNAAQNVEPLGDSPTWHVFGHDALIQAITDAMTRVKSTITIVTPTAEPKILEKLSQIAFNKKSSRFLYTSNWDLGTYGDIIEKMKQLGNIQFRNLKKANNFFAMSRDSEEIVLCPQVRNEKNQIAIVSIQQGYAEIFSSFIYPMFQANSRPI